MGTRATRPKYGSVLVRYHLSMEPISYLWVGPHLFAKHEKIPTNLAILFTEDDRQVEGINIKAAQTDLSSPTEAKTIYAAHVSTIKNRLDFLGFTLEAAADLFDFWKHEELKGFDDFIANMGARDQSYLEALSEYISYEKNKHDELQSHTFSSWLQSLKDPSAHMLDTVVFHPVKSFSPSDAWSPDRFPSRVDERLHLRCELEATNEQFITLDFTELDKAQIPLSDLKWCFEEVPQRDRNALRLIVLTEGSTDKFVLEQAIKILRPEIAHFISFFEFEFSRSPGGTSYLSHMVRSFVAAGIRDRIVAIFDNDTAGCLALQQLGNLKLPTNIKVTQYPNIDIAKNYPTLGPTGLVNMDINGYAASIELFLGEDVLVGDDGKFSPIQWKGFEPKLNRYQGEVLDKERCMRRFQRKVSASNHQRAKEDSTWNDLRTLLHYLLSLFNDLDRQLLLEEARQIVDSDA